LNNYGKFEKKVRQTTRPQIKDELRVFYRKEFIALIPERLRQSLCLPDFH
jgi:hypothetical protein